MCYLFYLKCDYRILLVKLESIAMKTHLILLILVLSIVSCQSQDNLNAVNAPTAKTNSIATPLSLMTPTATPYWYALHMAHEHMTQTEAVERIIRATEQAHVPANIDDASRFNLTRVAERDHNTHLVTQIAHFANDGLTCATPTQAAPRENLILQNTLKLLLMHTALFIKRYVQQFGIIRTVL